MYDNDDTTPKRSDVFPDDAAYYDDEPTGPGCAAWGAVSVFSVGLAGFVIVLAVVAGWNDGLRTARNNATATRAADIARQCAVLPTDVAAGRLALVQQRFDDLTTGGVALPDCAQAIVPQATQAYEASLATSVPTLTPTQQATLTSVPAEATAETTAEATTAPDSDTASDSRFDPAALLEEAETLVLEANNRDAIRTLDAIKRIDPNFQAQRVNELLFRALTNRANQIRLSNEPNLGEMIQLIERARNYGDVGELSFEQTVAELYLQAQSFIDIDYQRAINALQQVRQFSPNYRDTNALLLDQMEKAGDAFLASGDPCAAEQQFNSALQLQPNNPSLTSKRDRAMQQCQLAQTPGAEFTADPNATPGAFPTTTPTIAPIGQPGT